MEKINPAKDYKDFGVIDKRKRGFFTISNHLLDIYGKLLGPSGISIYAALSRFAGRKRICFPAQKTIGEKIGLGTRSVYHYLGMLSDFNIISIKRDRKENGKFYSLTYILNDSSLWRSPSAINADGKRGHTPSANNGTNHAQSLPNKKMYSEEDKREEKRNDLQKIQDGDRAIRRLVQ